MRSPKSPLTNVRPSRRSKQPTHSIPVRRSRGTTRSQSSGQVVLADPECVHSATAAIKSAQRSGLRLRGPLAQFGPGSKNPTAASFLNHGGVSQEYSRPGIFLRPDIFGKGALSETQSAKPSKGRSRRPHHPEDRSQRRARGDFSAQ
jgi:hypothetical protein